MRHHNRTTDAAAGGARNRLVAALPEADRNALLAGMQVVGLAPKQILHSSNTPLKHAYFPSAGAISLLMPAEGKAIEIAMIGNEGMFGLPVFFGSADCPVTALSHSAGQALRVTADFFRARVRESAALTAILGRYAQAFTVTLAQGFGTREK